MSAWRERFIGLPFHNDDSEGGAHCWGLVRRVFRDELAEELPVYGELSAEDMVAMANAVDQAITQGPWRAIPSGQEREFDVALFRGPVEVDGKIKRLVNHVGIITSDRHVLHVERATAAVCIPLDHDTIKWRYAGAQRYVRPI